MPRSLVAAATNWLRTLRYNYLAVPAAIALAFAGLAFALLALDAAAGPSGVGGLFPAGAPAARAILTTIAGSLATTAGVAFSVTIVTLQLVSQQFTPRAVRGFLGDRLIQVVAGVFVGVIVYCLVTLRAIEEGEREFVAGLTVSVAFVLAVVALGMLLVFIHHVAQSIQAGEITRRIAEATTASVARLYPGSYGTGAAEDAEAVVERWEEEGEPLLVFPERAGFVQAVDAAATTVAGEGLGIELVAAPGDFVTTRHPLARVWSTRDDGEDCAAAIRRAIAVGAERDLAQDAGYGIRQLADVAIKALSPSVNDPTTAATAIGYLQELFEQLAQRPWPPRVRRSAERDVTLVLRRDTFCELVEVLVQVGRYAADAFIVRALMQACVRIRQAAVEAGADERAEAVAVAARRIAARARAGEGLDDADRSMLATLEERLAREP